MVLYSMRRLSVASLLKNAEQFTKYNDRTEYKMKNSSSIPITRTGSMDAGDAGSNSISSRRAGDVAKTRWRQADDMSSGAISKLQRRTGRPVVDVS